MRPGRPESIWQPPRGQQSPGEHLLSQGHQAIASLGQEVWEALEGTSLPLEFFKDSTASLSEQHWGMGERKNKLSISVPSPSGDRFGRLLFCIL